MSQASKSITVKGLGTVSYEPLGRLSAEQLNQALSSNVVDDPISKKKTNLYNLFNEIDDKGNRAAAPFSSNLGAKNPVDFYRLIYNTTIPENKKTYTVSGLLAVPVLPAKQDNKSKTPSIPLLSWQHGTILTPYDAPSFLIQNSKVVRGPTGIPASAETLFNAVRFAGNGYALAAADYIGNGISTETQAYAVKGATIQTTKDMITGATAVIKELMPNTSGNPISKLVLNGWSQGGLNTAWLGNALQNDGVIVHKQAQASAPVDVAKTISYWFNDYPGTPNWLTACVPLAIGAYEKYYGIKDLMKAAIGPKYLDTANKIYNKQIDWSKVPEPPKGQGLLGLPVKAKDMLNKSFLVDFNAKRGEFYKQVTANTALQDKYKWPTRFYGGSGDTIVPPTNGVNQPVAFQQAKGSNLSAGFDMGLAATHRGTFLSSVFEGVTNPGNSILTWFNAA